VIAARSTFSLGVDALGATVNGGPVPDGQYLAWLGQFQWVRRFDDRGDQFVFRTDLQLAEDPLLPLEQFAVGGASTVRGYRENQLVRDNGFVTSAELRIPTFRLAVSGLSLTEEDGVVQLARLRISDELATTAAQRPTPRPSLAWALVSGGTPTSAYTPNSTGDTRSATSIIPKTTCRIPASISGCS
jgi:hypothetical protein